MVNKSGITKLEKTDEWYTKPETVALMYSLLDILSAKTIICPFDTAKSHFVIQGQKHANKVLFGMTDWLTLDYEYDYLITNPPFSIKDNVIERCLKSKKPSALILPIDALGGKRRHDLYAEYGHPTVYIPKRRINYISDNGLETKANHFHSVILILNDPKGSRLIWE
jgi:hypothetical protein